MRPNLPDSPPAGITLPSLWCQLSSLFLIEMTNWRWSWRGMLITGTLAPVVSILGLGIFARDSGPLALAYVLTGNMVLSIMFGNMGAVESHVTFMRSQGTLEYFASLPIYRPLLLLVIPLCAIPLSGIGALVGAAVRIPEYGSALNLVITLILTGLGPVVIPPDRLPPVFLWLGWLSPATYAASALRQVVLGSLSPRLALDLAVLAFLGVVIFWLVGRKLDWRQEMNR